MRLVRYLQPWLSGTGARWQPSPQFPKSAMQSVTQGLGNDV